MRPSSLVARCWGAAAAAATIDSHRSTSPKTRADVAANLRILASSDEGAGHRALIIATRSGTISRWAPVACKYEMRSAVSATASFACALPRKVMSAARRLSTSDPTHVNATDSSRRISSAACRRRSRTSVRAHRVRDRDPGPVRALRAQLADRLEHPVAAVAVSPSRRRRRLLSRSDCERGRGPRLQTLRPRRTHNPREIPRTSRKRRRSSRQEVVRPRIVARSVCWRGSASRPPGEEVEPLAQPVEQLLRREGLRFALRRARSQAGAARAGRRGSPSAAQRSVRHPSLRLALRRAAGRRPSLRPGTASSARRRVAGVRGDVARTVSCRPTSRRSAAMAPTRRRGAGARSCRGRAAASARRVRVHEPASRSFPAPIPSACASAGSMSAASRSGASATQCTPSANRSRRPARSLEREPRLARAAGAGESDEARVLAGESASTSASSDSRPRKGVGGTGRCVRGSPGAGGGAAGSAPAPSRIWTKLFDERLGFAA